MSIKISFKKSILGKTFSNLVLFVDEKFNTKLIKKYISVSEFSYISDLLKTCDLKKKLLIFELSSKKKIVLVSTNFVQFHLVHLLRLKNRKYFLTFFWPHLQN